MPVPVIMPGGYALLARTREDELGYLAEPHAGHVARAVKRHLRGLGRAPASNPDQRVPRGRSNGTRRDRDLRTGAYSAAGRSG